MAAARPPPPATTATCYYCRGGIRPMVPSSLAQPYCLLLFCVRRTEHHGGFVCGRWILEWRLTRHYPGGVRGIIPGHKRKYFVITVFRAIILRWTCTEPVIFSPPFLVPTQEVTTAFVSVFSPDAGGDYCIRICFLVPTQEVTTAIVPVLFLFF